MGVQTVFSGITSTTNVNLSERFTNAIGFFISAPLIDAEIEIDVFLQIYLPNEQIRNIPLGKITEQAVLLNLTDTESVSVIPEEFQDTNLEMALLFLPSELFTLEVFVITKEMTLVGLSEEIKILQERMTNTSNIVRRTRILVADIAFVLGLFLPGF